MLVITRKLNDSIVIQLENSDEIIEVKVTEIGSQVRLGITAPGNCKIWRKELYQTVKENRSAAAPSAENLRGLASQLKKAKGFPKKEKPSK